MHGVRADQGFSGSGLERVDEMKFLARLEAYGFAWGNGHFSAGPRVAADASLAWLDGEDAKSTELNAIASDECLLHAFEDGVHGGFRLCPWQTSALNNPLYKILLNHLGAPSLGCIFYKL